MFRNFYLSLGLAILAIGQPGVADVITYTDGRVVKGLIEETAGTAENITIRTDTGRVGVPKSRVANIQRESQAQGYIHLGDAFYSRQKYQEALREYQQALTLEPGNLLARQGLDATQQAVSSERNATRQQALQEIDSYTSQVQQLIQSGRFEDAEKLLQEADRRVPNDDQRAKLKLIISHLYYQWGNDRKDKLDVTGAEMRYRMALAANPDNREVVDEMLRLWENKPDKREQLANIYATMLENHPNDIELRKKLADLYFQLDQFENATKHYLELYRNSEQFRGTQVEERLITLLDRLHRQYARNKDYDKAIQYYQMLAAIDDQTDPSQVIYYQYLKQAEATPQTDVPGQLRLAGYAEQNGLDQQALRIYRAIQTRPQVADNARQGIARYAQKDFGEAEAQFKRGNFELAMSLADSVRRDYADVAGISDRAAELIGRAQAEAERNRRQARERARDILERADEFYQQANNYFNDLFSLDRRNNPYLMSTRNEAAKYYRYAIQAYEDALRIDPSLGTESNSLVQVRLQESRTRLRRLSGGSVEPFKPGAPIPDVTANRQPISPGTRN